MYRKPRFDIQKMKRDFNDKFNESEIKFFQLHLQVEYINQRKEQKEKSNLQTIA